MTDAKLAPWTGYVDLMKAAAEVENQLWLPGDEALRAALYRQFAMNLSQGYFLYFQSTPDHPDWMPFENSVFLAQPNPDAVYYRAPVNGRGVYRVTGQRGTSPVVGFATGNKIIGSADEPGKGFNNYDLDHALDINDDGTFEVVFSSERPEGHTGNWLYLHPDSDFILTRQFSYDWGNEVDIRLSIERVDTPSPTKPMMSVEETDRLLRELFGGYVRRLSALCQWVVNRARERGLHQMWLNDYAELGNSGEWPQAYFECAYELAPGEALILETELPEEKVYWNVQVIDALWNQAELVHNQSSLNGHQARIDSDGKFRAVLSLEDPGVANWLDTAGSRQGMLIGRWYRCSSHPLPSLKKVKLAEVPNHLPGDTPAVSAAERAEALQIRRRGAQLRRRW